MQDSDYLLNNLIKKGSENINFFDYDIYNI